MDMVLKKLIQHITGLNNAKEKLEEERKNAQPPKIYDVSTLARDIEEEFNRNSSPSINKSNDTKEKENER